MVTENKVKMKRNMKTKIYEGQNVVFEHTSTHIGIQVNGSGEKARVRKQVASWVRLITVRASDLLCSADVGCRVCLCSIRYCWIQFDLDVNIV